ncbi:MAG TPA: F0F1 ATP synthase subunit B [Ktedonobacteraceae bacterium]|nr:F0F1 ATP synthase subunit B [Ktedonobacteraceae bacterium]
MVQILSAAVVGDLLGGLGINTIAFLSQLVSFGIVFWILWRWGLPAITKTIDKRNAVISEGVENAEKARKALEDAKKDAEQLLLDARRQGQETIAQATRAAENEANRIREEAEARSKQIEQQYAERIQQEAARARAELNRLVVNLTINAASKVISKSVDSSDNRRLVEEFVTSSNSGNGDNRAKEQ